MTVSSSIRKVGPFAGDGTTTVFPFPFKVFTSADLYLTTLDSLGNIRVLALTTDYSVTLNTNQDVSPGGNTVLNVPLAVGTTLIITSQVSPLQLTNLINQGGFYPAVITAAYDKLTILTQQIYEILGRTLTLNITDSTNPAALLAALQYLNATLFPNEVSARINGDNALQANINAEVITRAYNDGQLQANINTEASYRSAGDTNLQANINTEAAIRASVDARAILFPIADTSQANPLPLATLRAGKFLSFDAAGQPVVSSGTGNDSALRTDLTATNGASRVGFQQNGSGAVSRTVLAKMQETVSVTDFGAIADGVQLSDGAITTGTAILTSATANFKTTDVGKMITVCGAGASGAMLQTTILSQQSATQVTLASNASTTVSGATIVYGTNNASAIVAAHTASRSVRYPVGNYAVLWSENTTLVTYSGVSGIRIIGEGATIFDARQYAVNGFSPLFSFNSCTDIDVNLNYQGVPIVNKSNPTVGVGYVGAIFVQIYTSCKRIKVKGNLKYLRYGLQGGDYATPSLGNNDDIIVDFTTVECGYPVALYLATRVDIKLITDSSHRSCYLAGVRGGKVEAYFINQYIAPIQVILTDATTNGLTYPSGTSVGCSNLRVKAYDLGSTTYVANSFCAGISMSRGDSNVIFQDIEFDLYLKTSDTIAPSMNLFGLYNNFTPIQPSYPSNWNSTMVFKNITVRGVLDRGAQQTAGASTNGSIYIYMTDGTNNAIASGINLKDVRYVPPAAGLDTRGIYYFVPGLVGGSSFENCDFGTNIPIAVGTNASSVVSMKNCVLQGSYLSTTDSPYLSNINFIDCNISSLSKQPMTNKQFTNTTVQGAGLLVKMNMTSMTLSGASTTWPAAIPPNAIVLGVTGYVSTAITGAPSFNVGTSASTTAFASARPTAAGTTWNISNNAATSPFTVNAYTDIVAYPTSGSFTGGVVTICVSYMLMPSPTS